MDGGLLRKGHEILEGKLDAHLKEVELPLINRGVDAVFHDRINVVEHDPHRGIEVPVHARGEISSLLTLLPFAEVQSPVSVFLPMPVAPQGQNRLNQAFVYRQ